MKRYVIVTTTQRVIFTPKLPSSYSALYWVNWEAPKIKRIRGHEGIAICRESVDICKH